MILSRDEETIIAQCTPSGKGALAIIRLSGAHALAIADALAELPSGKKLEQVTSHTVHYGWVRNREGQRIDQVMFIVMRSPRTFTGQDTVEVTCHNNPFIIQDIIAQAIAHGARLAEEGEFTRRAFMQGKIDLIQAESINELIHANTQTALKKALAQLEGSLSQWLVALEKELLKALAWSEASFEFLDEEVSFGAQIAEHITALLYTIYQLKSTFDAQQQIRSGIKIALLGSTNAGKSSLFNALLNQKRAIVTDIAGTTRDTIEAGIYRNGNYWTLIDTAGLRNTNDIIEQEGIERSHQEAHKADIILLVVDGSRALTDEEAALYNQFLQAYPEKIILVQNKSDIITQASEHTLLITPACPTIRACALTREHIDTLEQLIEEKISAIMGQLNSPFLLNKRQYTLLLTLEQKLQQIIPMLNAQNVQYELISYHLQDVLESLTELTGKSISEAGLDMVFKEFCVGK